MMTEKNTAWLITGCSTGFGHELAKAVLARGFSAVITARDTAPLAALAKEYPESALVLQLNVNHPEQIANAVAQAKARFGGINVLVNNAGYGYQSSIEEGEDAEIRAQFETNVFGLFALTRAVLPVMRAARHGYIINITSVAGFIGFPGSGYYAASKHAVEGFSDALAAEVAPLGIHVTCVAPGPFRTDWAGRSLKQTPTKIADYEPTAGARLKATAGYSGTQAGDPARAAAAMIALTEIPNPPRHLVLGAFGIEAVTKKLAATLAEIEVWRETGLLTDFPADS
jgi:NAD(P)-dependent dehydrogenase (short-subunit alcohol dehydrogenase family)